VSRFTTALGKPIPWQLPLAGAVGGQARRLRAVVGDDCIVLSLVDQLLAQVGSDGTVDQIVDYLMPELYGDGTSSIPGVAALRPLLLESCRQSKVPCHFLDLQSVWSGHPEYDTGSSPPVATNAGGTAIADAIWATMQTYCIVQ
jgi:hypothetical protein